MTRRYVDTAYGPAPGCPDCGTIPLTAPLLCEHGVTPAPTVELAATITVRDPELHRRLRDAS